VELAAEIHRRTGKFFSRSIISRHLKELGFTTKYCSHIPTDRTDPEHVLNRRVYANILLPFMSSSSTLIFIDEQAVFYGEFARKRLPPRPTDSEADDYVSVIVSSTAEEVIDFHIVRHRFIDKNDFIDFVNESVQKVIETRYEGVQPPFGSIVLITDTHEIHYDDPSLPGEQR
jgi:hypothetical protein